MKANAKTSLQPNSSFRNNAPQPVPNAGTSSALMEALLADVTLTSLNQRKKHSTSPTRVM